MLKLIVFVFVGEELVVKEFKVIQMAKVTSMILQKLSILKNEVSSNSIFVG